ncbi:MULTISPECIES: hypothetical protein [Pseudomonas]|uniref:hypothetical protein n=1 Tax=Pseudomonas TaxID=286 RepID=UPI002AC9BF96|nr:hypothetical protein [Pseudomonas sp. CCI1.1]MEB0190011.1 hypothetical protein [Pseudomonas sp. CCI1.1]WPX48362.1 hypothetical protein RHM69_29360 [Pseudomonas sp. CCI1.1]
MPEENVNAWTGEGLPPVGTVCQFQDLGFDEQFKDDLEDGHTVKVIAHYEGPAGDMVAAFTFDYDGGNSRDVECATKRHLRPILTPEQIAAKEREAAIAEIAQEISSCLPYRPDALAKALHDAGYRKSVTS